MTQPDTAVHRRRLPELLAALLLLIAVVRIVSTYHVLSQAYDEPATVGAGMEWLDKGTYALDPFHPPLARVAAALGPYLSGIRLGPLRTVQDEKGVSSDIFGMGDDVLYEGNHYWRTLSLARLGMLPFFILGVVVVFYWTREIAGDTAAIFAVLFLTTIPPILAFAGFAYTDMPVAMLIAASLYAFTYWLKKPDLKRSVVFGIFSGLAVLANFPAFLFLPACWLATIVCWLWLADKKDFQWKRWLLQAVLASVVFFTVIWGGYRFSLKRLNEIYAKPAEDVQALHINGVVKRALKVAVAVNAPIPAPELLRGFGEAFFSNARGRPSYLLGHIQHGGWRYFFLVVVAFKSPLPLLILAAVGIVASFLMGRRQRQWTLLVPCFCAVVVLLASMVAKVNYGRNILTVYPFLAAVAGIGAMQLWNAGQNLRSAGRVFVCLLLGWLVLSTTLIHPDYVAYFNVLAGSHPEKVLLWGCDYDCGQDAGRLARMLREHKIEDVSLSVFTTAELGNMGVPRFRNLAPYEKATGWVAASERMLLTGDVFWGHRHVDGYRWLLECEPVARAGKTIYLYYLPCEPAKKKPTPDELPKLNSPD
jgi:Dolichyl-phosphate-mannose-protein mannosyltransferase